MASSPVSSKRDMYARLAAGEFGNTNPAWYSFREWDQRKLMRSVNLWGIRALAAGDKRLALDVPQWDVERRCREYPEGFQISPMVDSVATFRGEAWVSPELGLTVRGGPYQRHIKWREFLARAKTLTGLRAAMVLTEHMWPADLENFNRLLESYDNHVVEFTTCQRAMGTIPRRNTIIWEVRLADGTYEKWNTQQKKQ